MNPSTPTSKITQVGSPSPSPPSSKRVKHQSGIEVTEGCTILMTGLAKSGKTTISNALTQKLKSNGILVKQIDGKCLRAGLCKNLDLDNTKDRSEFVHLASELAKTFTEEGFVSIISIVAPLQADRETAKQSHNKDGLNFVEVFVDRSSKECKTGLDRNVLNPIESDYEPPPNPDVHLQRSGNNVNKLATELVAKLVGYKYIPPFFAQPQSPVSPLNRPTPSPKASTPLPSTASPSPSTTDSSDSSDVDIDDGELDDEGNSVPKFKLPRKSNNRTIFDYVKSVLVQRGFTGKDEEVDNHPLFFALMGEWRTHYETHKTGGMEKFFPAKVRARSKSATPTKTPTKCAKTPSKGAKTPQKDDVKNPEENKWDEFIPLYWNGSTLCYGSMHQGFPHLKKCKQCWSQSTSEGYLCNLHSTNRLQHIVVLHDTNENAIHYHAVLNLSVLKKEWTKQVVQTYAHNMTQVMAHLSTHPAAKFSPICENSFLLSSPERLPATHSMTLSVALITLFRNMEKIETGAPIKPHSFLHKQFNIFKANLAVVEKILEENGVTSSVGDNDNTSSVSSPLIDKDRYCKKLPRIYCGVETDNKINVGLKTSKTGEEDHSAYIHSDQFKSGPIYQTPLSDEQLAIANNIDTSKSFKQWTDQQRDVFDLVKKDCTRKEGLGHAALILAEMKGQSYNGILIRRDNQKYEHVDTIERGDRAFVQAVFKLLTGRSLTVSVKHTDNMSFNGEI